MKIFMKIVSRTLMNLQTPRKTHTKTWKVSNEVSCGVFQTETFNLNGLSAKAFDRVSSYFSYFRFIHCSPPTSTHTSRDVQWVWSACVSETGFQRCNKLIRELRLFSVEPRCSDQQTTVNRLKLESSPLDSCLGIFAIGLLGRPT